ncbi:cysteine desulfurase [Thermosulfuriphilus ammonigenes]|uniref:cysteine desulfurase n=1 Tax=Thermosulfuriphilus ammonigenes TaxID=1936021 RepID=A0A6G7PVY4_9BACT|nr:cysteine desulfurase family protein [Thermosulfuriphilus ammonigenes]MBA2848104.1 cysteine desulfurase [Thermosulfuriphilus ammonigenes]QIJ71716.1 cysteine desulfurase [Thermosulfuriphilus ammonigenes]
MDCYFDHVATTPLRPEVLEAMLPYLKEEFGNPLSVYPLGVKAREAIEEAREKVAGLIGAKASEIVFTSNGAEANNFAVQGIARAMEKKGRHIIVSLMEHHSVLNPARFLEKQGFVVSFIKPDKFGLIDPDEVRRAIRKETILISVIMASPEVGTIEPIAEIARVARENGVVFHTDAVAAVGNIPVNVEELGVDLLSMSAHQFYGPKGAGALYIRKGLRITPLIFGGIQENGRRAGTENVPAIVGMGKAAELAQKELPQRMEHVKRLRDMFVAGITGEIDHLLYTGHREKRLPGHASFCVEFVEGEAMLLLLASKGIYAASGSACTSKALKASPVLLSMGVPAHIAQGSVVFSFGQDNNEEQIKYALREFPQVVKRLRELSPFGQGWGEMEGGLCTRKR